MPRLLIRDGPSHNDILAMIPYPERQGRASTKYARCVPNITDETRAKILTMDPDLYKCRARDMDALIQAMGVPKALMKDFDRFWKRVILEQLCEEKAFGGLLNRFNWRTREGQKASKISKDIKYKERKDKIKAREDAIFEAGRQSVLREYGLL